MLEGEEDFQWFRKGFPFSATFLSSPLLHPGPSAFVLFLDQVGFGDPYIRTVCVSFLVSSSFSKLNNAPNVCAIARTPSLAMREEEEKSHLSSGSLIYIPWNGY